jgi:hypothetical protein
MLRELNNVASDLLGLHGYPVGPMSHAETSAKRTCATAPKDASVAHALRVDKPAAWPMAATAVRARSYFAW